MTNSNPLGEVFLAPIPSLNLPLSSPRVLSMTDAEGRTAMVDTLAATPPLIFQGGLLFDATGRLVVTSTNPIASFNAGLAFDSTGALCVVLTT